MHTAIKRMLYNKRIPPSRYWIRGACATYVCQKLLACRVCSAGSVSTVYKIQYSLIRSDDGTRRTTGNSGDYCRLSLHKAHSKPVLFITFLTYKFKYLANSRGPYSLGYDGLSQRSHAHLHLYLPFTLCTIIAITN